MSTTTLAYPNTIQLRRVSLLRWITIMIISSALVASVILVAALSATTNTSSNNPGSGIVAIAVPTVPDVNIQIPPTETPAPETSPAVIAVPVPEPPSQ
jgi:hypothetical protein